MRNRLIVRSLVGTAIIATAACQDLRLGNAGGIRGGREMIPAIQGALESKVDPVSTIPIRVTDVTVTDWVASFGDQERRVYFSATIEVDAPGTVWVYTTLGGGRIVGVGPGEGTPFFAHNEPNAVLAPGDKLTITGATDLELRQSGWAPSQGQATVIFSDTLQVNRRATDHFPGTANTNSSAEMNWTEALASDLKNLITAQEAYWADHGAYASSIDAIQAAGLIRVDPAHTIAITSFPTGFRIVAVRTGTSARCTVQVGGGIASHLDGRISCTS